MKLEPMGQNILIEQDNAPEKIGSLYVVDGASEKPQIGTVIAVSPLVDDIKIGFRVLFGKFSGTNISWEEKNYTLLKKEDVFCVVVKGELTKKEK